MTAAGLIALLKLLLLSTEIVFSAQMREKNTLKIMIFVIAPKLIFCCATVVLAFVVTVAGPHICKYIANPPSTYLDLQIKALKI